MDHVLLKYKTSVVLVLYFAMLVFISCNAMSLISF